MLTDAGRIRTNAGQLWPGLTTPGPMLERIDLRPQTSDRNNMLDQRGVGGLDAEHELKRAAQNARVTWRCDLGEKATNNAPAAVTTVPSSARGESGRLGRCGEKACIRTMITQCASPTAACKRPQHAHE